MMMYNTSDLRAEMAEQFDLEMAQADDLLHHLMEYNEDEFELPEG